VHVPRVACFSPVLLVAAIPRAVAAVSRLAKRPRSGLALTRRTRPRSSTARRMRTCRLWEHPPSTAVVHRHRRPRAATATPSGRPVPGKAHRPGPVGMTAVARLERQHRPHCRPWTLVLDRHCARRASGCSQDRPGRRRRSALAQIQGPGHAPLSIACTEFDARPREPTALHIIAAHRWSSVLTGRPS
jgi:hypothetical protein